MSPHVTHAVITPPSNQVGQTPARAEELGIGAFHRWIPTPDTTLAGCSPSSGLLFLVARRAPEPVQLKECPPHKYPNRLGRMVT
jgi:hypothetical protein